MPKTEAVTIPKDGIFVAVFRRRKRRKKKRRVLELLCVKHSYRQRYYSLPGGGLETEDGSPQARGRDEVREETGLLIRLIRIIGIFTLQREPEAIPEVVLLFQGQDVGGKLSEGVNPGEISWCGYRTLREIRKIGAGPEKFSPYQLAMAEFAFQQEKVPKSGHHQAVMGELTEDGVKPLAC